MLRCAKVELAHTQNETISTTRFRSPTARSPSMTTGPYRAAWQKGFEMSGP